MQTPAKFLILSISGKKLYQMALDGAGWEEFPVQPTIVGVPTGMLCGTPDGRIAIGDGSVRVQHWDPATRTWFTTTRASSGTAYKAVAVGPAGDMITHGSFGVSYSVDTYTAATRTWARIYSGGFIHDISGTSLTDIWMVTSVSTTGYVYHWDGVSWSANRWPSILSWLGFDPNVPKRVVAVSPTEVYITTSPGTLSYDYEKFAQLIGYNGDGYAALHSHDDMPAPYGDGVPDCAGWNASSSAIDGGLLVDASGRIFTSGNFITITTNYIKEFAVGDWSNIGTFTQTAGSCYAPIIAAGGSLLVYGLNIVPILRLFRGGVWTDVTTGFVGSSGSQPALLYGARFPFVPCGEPRIGSDFSLNHYLCLAGQHTSPDDGAVFTVPFILGNPAAGIQRFRTSAPSSSIEQRMNTGNNTISTEQITQIISGSIE